jgi:HlyD family secretion protein
MQEGNGIIIRTIRSTFFLASILIPLLLTLGGCSSTKESEPTPTVTVQATTAQKKAIQSTVDGDAILYPRDQAALVPRINAPVKKFYVDKGTRVHAGQLLAELEDKDLQGAFTENQGGYQQAEAAYNTAVAKARQDAEVAKQQFNEQKKIYESRQALYKQGAVSAKDVSDAQIAFTQAQGQYEAAQKQYDLKAAEGQLTAAKGKNASAAAQLSYTKIVSPINGVVTDRPFYPGETVPAGSPILTVMDLSQVIARTHVAQQEAAELKIGDAAKISVPGQDLQIPGQVSLVSPALDANSTTVEVWVQAANSQSKLKAGSSVRVSIVSETVPDAIVVPIVSLLSSSEGPTSVIMLDSSNKPHKQAVKLGIRNDTDAQIIEGLKEGDRVVTVGAFELDKEDEAVLAKTKIQIEPSKPAAAEGGEKE